MVTATTTVATATTATAANGENNNNNNNKYRALVIDSGPIIKLTGVSSLRDRADAFYTVPAVLGEIRDAKARQHLDTLPFVIETRDPSPASVQAVTEFARLTGDYQSLSSVDLIVLALVYELEQEGCGGAATHIRTTPKRTVGVGKVELLSAKKDQVGKKDSADGETKDDGKNNEEDIEYDEVEDSEEENEDHEEEKVSFFEQSPTQPEPEPRSDTVITGGPKSWASLVNPAKASSTSPVATNHGNDGETTAAFVKMNLDNNKDGQFSDAEDDEIIGGSEEVVAVEEFPSLAAASHVPYEPEDDEMEPLEYEAPSTTAETAVTESNNANGPKRNDEVLKAKEMAEEDRKKEAVKPISNSGKLYNSFRGYNKLFKPKAAPDKKATPDEDSNAILEETLNYQNNIFQEDDEITEEENKAKGQSRIMGGVNMSGQEVDVEDDGEGWITSTKDIRSLQATGSLAPQKNPLDEAAKQGPPLCQRTACATTDFAMQNVLLQMNLHLLSVDGVKIRRLKNWVTRCGACFKVYTNGDAAGPHGMKRLFCERCGSDMLQRIAASVDGKTGRLRLHMSKKHKTSTRGTKFSLPKPGTVRFLPVLLTPFSICVLLGAFHADPLDFCLTSSILL